MQRSKVTFTRGQRQTWRPDGDIILDLLGSSSFSSFSELVDSGDIVLIELCLPCLVVIS